MSSSLILINPCIYDFAAYDLWSKPLGLLYIAGFLRHCGFEINLIDCLDIHNPGMKKYPASQMPARRSYGTGKFWREEKQKPTSLRDIKRTYSRYGISEEIFIQELKKCGKPEAILVTSLMTYWYPGVKNAIKLAKQTFPGTPVILGGIYARLCQEHASTHMGADIIITKNDLASVVKDLNECGIYTLDTFENLEYLPYPAFDLLSEIDYITILTSVGCPYSCKYCASRFLNPHFTKRAPLEVLDEILYWHKEFGIRDFAFYDDALLVSWERHLGVLLEELARLRLGLRFHTPNAVHAREVTPELAHLLKRTGFRTLRLGLESSDFSLHSKLDDKIAEGEFERAIMALLKAAFTPREIGAYILMGLPGQTSLSVEDTINFVGKAGVTPYLSEYPPIPYTSLWEEAVKCSEYDLIAEPLFQNNTLLPCWNEEQRAKVPRLKKRVREIRENLS